MDSLYSIFAVMFVLALLGLTLVVLRRRGVAAWRNPLGQGSKRRLEMVERLALGPQQALYVVRVSGRPVVIAVSPSGCQLLPVSVEEGLS